MIAFRAGVSGRLRHVNINPLVFFKALILTKKTVWDWEEANPFAFRCDASGT